ncbi:MAG TPA: YdeI/OmpD-associated family protein [Sphingobacteriaceae bacterium]
MAGENPIVRKLLIKPAHRVLLVNAPASYPAELDPLPRETQLDLTAYGQYDVIQLFVSNRQELERDLSWLQDHLRDDTILWITYPKKNSGIPSDLGMMESWDETAVYGLSGVAAAAIDQTWTALRFRPSDQIKKSDVRNAAISNNALGEFIDVVNRLVSLPPDLKAVLETNPHALNFFNELSYTNKKEYVTWILTAKQAKTREDRVSKTVGKLLNGKKNPSQK